MDDELRTILEKRKALFEQEKAEGSRGAIRRHFTKKDAIEAATSIVSGVLASLLTMKLLGAI